MAKFCFDPPKVAIEKTFRRNFGFFPIRICSFLTHSFAPILMEDAQCAESNEKSVFRFLFFELSSILFTIFKCFYLNSHKILHTKKILKSDQIYMKDALCPESIEKSILN